MIAHNQVTKRLRLTRCRFRASRMLPRREMSPTIPRDAGGKGRRPEAGLCNTEAKYLDIMRPSEIYPRSPHDTR
ncbi:hypothetical protein MCOR27_006592 [Pyricularia oryzae]|uniref:Uncharacterized protein n=4 Tax=Pyricularia oryzae TaxID=318829 RepID=G4N5D9_PYRO7|nr:uncharacterized protein MGG_16898 [Pyricularia oryzae 70-15]ELQ35388.1 hypothetical protein OOU_Y34scaffold00711g28 [Pyricularia oryzae Y34]KAH9429879.1 hypothetical protein MCOR02_009609 [Pyricularia oryzae]EHA52996.1 hypothetical protein MGG_16898 [Pyricularia oryzae 70-15]KAI6276222.1 hypothetical protein MCOR27_006592 [Pyricularia oryzae]KAI6320495.1 hypothetical protein MCOR29_005333 [Pyricularia oryzae]